LALTSKAPAGEASPFHLAHEQMALEWQAVAHAHGLQVTGSYDPWHVEVEIRNNRMRMRGERHLMTRRGPLIEPGSPYQERVTFNCTLPTHQAPRIRVIRKRPWNLVERLFAGHRDLPFDERYAHIGPSEWLESSRILLPLLIDGGLGRLSIKGDQARFELHMLPRQGAHLERIVRELDHQFKFL
jgi:hypothetical protein